MKLSRQDRILNAMLQNQEAMMRALALLSNGIRGPRDPALARTLLDMSANSTKLREELGLKERG